MIPVTRAANRRRSPVEGLHTCVALHRCESRGQYGAFFLRSFVRCLHLPTSLDSTGITPLQRYYGGSVTFRARFFGLYLQP
jgi:hypothetical protein